MSEKPTVVLLSPTPPPMHGAAYAVQLLLNSSFAEKFHVVHINAKFVEKVSDLQKLTPKKLLLVGKYLLELASACLKFRVRAVILTPALYTKPFLKDAIFILVAKLLGRRVVAWHHMNFKAMNFENLPKAMQWFVRKILGLCDFHVLVGEKLIENIPKFIPRDKITSIHNGIPAIEVRKSPNPVLSQKISVLYVSNMAIDKGWRTLFEAAEDVCRQKNEVEFLFYGNPTADSSLEEINRTFSGSKFFERIKYCGFADEKIKADAFSKADIFCFPSFNEAFPLTILEAMSAGLPVIASDVGAVREAIAGGENGIIVPPRDKNGLATAILRLADDKNLRLEMGIRTKSKFSAEFTVSAYAKKWENFLEKVI